MTKIFIVLCMGMTYISCNSTGSYDIQFSENTCIKEMNRSYASLKSSPKSIYKLEKISSDSVPRLSVSVWHNHSWYYQGKKKYSYFNNTNLFKYAATNCPDGQKMKLSITDKLKAIEI